MARRLVLIVLVCVLALRVFAPGLLNDVGRMLAPSSSPSGDASAHAKSTTTFGKQEAPPARETWGNPGSLPDHFARHGADFHAKDAEEYAAMAWQFGQRAKQGGLLVKVDEGGTRRVFDPKTGAFAAYNADGTTKTFFKPNSRDYFARQPGRAP